MKEKGGREDKTRACEKIITPGEGRRCMHTLFPRLRLPVSLALNLDGVGDLRVNIMHISPTFLSSPSLSSHFPSPVASDHRGPRDTLT